LKITVIKAAVNAHFSRREARVFQRSKDSGIMDYFVRRQKFVIMKQTSKLLWGRWT